MCKQIPRDLVINTSFDSFALGLDPRSCISSNLPDHLSAVGAQAKLYVARLKRCWLLEVLVGIEAIRLAPCNFSPLEPNTEERLIKAPTVQHDPQQGFHGRVAM